MEYETEITVPFDTSDDEPIEETIRLTKGIISGYVYFPTGCVHLVKVRVLHGTFQIAPRNLIAWLRGEGTKVSFADNYELTEPPYAIKILASSPDTIYEHKPLIHVSINPTYLVRPENVIVAHLKQIKDLLAKWLGEEE